MSFIIRCPPDGSLFPTYVYNFILLRGFNQDTKAKLMDEVDIKVASRSLCKQVGFTTRTAVKALYEGGMVG